MADKAVKIRITSVLYSMLETKDKKLLKELRRLYTFEPEGAQFTRRALVLRAKSKAGSFPLLSNFRIKLAFISLIIQRIKVPCSQFPVLAEELNIYIVNLFPSSAQGMAWGIPLGTSFISPGGRFPTGLLTEIASTVLKLFFER